MHSAKLASSNSLLGVLDVGKTHTRFVTADLKGTVLSEHRRENGPGARSSLIRQLDLTGIEEWLCAVIRAHKQRDHIGALIPVAHGAACVLIDGNGQTLCAPDYEDPRFEEVSEQYRPERDRFEATYSPFLPLGLNLGRQLFYLHERSPKLCSKVRALLLFPQYWAWRMCGVAASEVTSLGCHSDLWRPTQRRVTDLAKRAGWDALLPRRRNAHDCLGTISTAFARRTGLPTECRVLCGLHDSNASLLAHSGLKSKEPIAIISSGTWTIVMARGTDRRKIREPMDMLMNVDVNGSPIPTARFMGGREYEVIAGEAGMRARPTTESLKTIMSHGIIAVPAFSQAGGPFANARGRVIGASKLLGRERASLASVYVALMTDYLLDLLGLKGSVIVDGPLGHNVMYLKILAQLRPADCIYRADDRCIAALAAANLVRGRSLRLNRRRVASSSALPCLERYRIRWRAEVASLPTK